MGNDIPTTKKNKSDKILVCLPYDKEELYAFYCSRYENIKYSEFLKLGYEEFNMKLNSIPESEPLYKIIKSRAININKIKDKNEKKYWRDLKEINKIPDIYKPIKELEKELKEKVKERGIKNVK